MPARDLPISGVSGSESLYMIMEVLSEGAARCWIPAWILEILELETISDPLVELNKSRFGDLSFFLSV